MFSILLLLVLAPAVLATPLAPRIHLNHDQNTCLTVRGRAQDIVNGQAVQIADCTGARHWVIKRGSTTMRLAGTTFCLDGGTEPGNGDPLKVWHCQGNLPGQRWHYTSDNRIKLENQGMAYPVIPVSLTLPPQLKSQTSAWIGAKAWYEYGRVPVAITRSGPFESQYPQSNTWEYRPAHFYAGQKSE